MENITWDQYTSGYNIPADWEDTSYGNDELPSFETNGYRIWVNSPDLAERKESQEHLGFEFRDWLFAITTTWATGADEDLLTTMDFDEVIEFVKTPIPAGLLNEISC
tara:strand:- start:70 stop:390 length:321 start_codon:yes stop_codon:yes gene_type:complete